MIFAAYLPAYHLKKRLTLLIICYLSIIQVLTLLKMNFKKIIEFSTSGTYFLFQGTFYDQIGGVALGSPLGPVLVNLFMGYYETM